MEQVKQYVTCERERTSGRGLGQLLYLISNLNVELGKARAFNITTDRWPNIDPKQPLYPIRGSFIWWTCSVVGNVGVERGKNCNKIEQPNATGVCYKDNFDDWNCKLSDASANDSIDKLPPPREE